MSALLDALKRAGLADDSDVERVKKEKTKKPIDDRFTVMYKDLRARSLVAHLVANFYPLAKIKLVKSGTGYICKACGMQAASADSFSNCGDTDITTQLQVGKVAVSSNLTDTILCSYCVLDLQRWVSEKMVSDKALSDEVSRNKI